MNINEIKLNHRNLIAVAEKKLPSKLSLAIALNIKELGKVLETAEETRKNICIKHTKKDENGAPIILTDTNNTKHYDIPEIEMADLNKELEEMFETETEVHITKVPADILDKCENSERFDILSAAEVFGLEFMMEV